MSNPLRRSEAETKIIIGRSHQMGLEAYCAAVWYQSSGKVRVTCSEDSGRKQGGAPYFTTG